MNELETLERQSIANATDVQDLLPDTPFGRAVRDSLFEIMQHAEDLYRGLLYIKEHGKRMPKPVIDAQSITPEKSPPDAAECFCEKPQVVLGQMLLKARKDSGKVLTEVSKAVHKGLGWCHEVESGNRSFSKELLLGLTSCYGVDPKPFLAIYSRIRWPGTNPAT